MDPEVWLVTGAAALALVAAFPLRTRLPSVAVAGLLTLAGLGVGWGGMLLQRDPSIGELIAAVAMLAFLFPAHARIVLGPFGPRR